MIEGFCGSMPGVTTPVAMPTPRSVRSVELTHRQIAGIILLACVPLPVLSLAATVVPLPEMVERAAARFIPFAPPTLGDESRRVAPTVAAGARPATANRRRHETGNVAQAVRTTTLQPGLRKPAAHRPDRAKQPQQPRQQEKSQQPAVAATEPSPEVPAAEPDAPVARSSVATTPAPAPAATEEQSNGNAGGQGAEKRVASEKSSVPDKKAEEPAAQAPAEPPGNSGSDRSNLGNHAGNEEKPVGNGRP